jgi:hypothetical protein
MNASPVFEGRNHCPCQAVGGAITKIFYLKINEKCRHHLLEVDEVGMLKLLHDFDLHKDEVLLGLLGQI